MLKRDKKKIDGMSTLSMAKIWRFAEAGDPMMEGESGDYFRSKFKERGGMTPALSKRIGWVK